MLPLLLWSSYLIVQSTADRTYTGSYVLTSKKTKAKKADKQCRKEYQTHAATIYSDVDNSNAWDVCQKKESKCFIGLTTDDGTAGEQEWYWYGDKSSSLSSYSAYSNWRSGQPQSKGERYAFIRDSESWDDCCTQGQKYRVVCDAPREYPAVAPDHGGSTDDTSGSQFSLCEEAWELVTDEVGYTHNGFVVSLYGTIKWKSITKPMGSTNDCNGGTGYIGLIIDADEEEGQRALPPYEQLFNVKNKFGLEAVITVDNAGRVKLKAYSLPVAYYNTGAKKYYFINGIFQEDGIEDLFTNVKPEVKELTEMQQISLDGVVFVSEAAAAFVVQSSDMFPYNNINDPNNNAPKPNIIDHINESPFAIMIGIAIGIGIGIGIKLTSNCIDAIKITKYSKIKTVSTDDDSEMYANN